LLSFLVMAVPEGATLEEPVIIDDDYMRYTAKLILPNPPPLGTWEGNWSSGVLPTGDSATVIESEGSVVIPTISESFVECFVLSFHTQRAVRGIPPTM